MGMKEIREARGLTQQQIADMIHMDKATVNRAENRAVSAKLATYIKIAKALDVTLGDLFADDRTAIEAALVAAFRSVPEDRREEWVRVLQLARAGGGAAEQENDVAQQQSDTRFRQ